MAGREDPIGALRADRVVPVIRADSAREAHRQAETCLAAGMRLVELTATTPDWEDLTVRLAADHPEAIVGVGTVTTAEHAAAALAAGASFLVAPYAAPEVRAAGAAAGVPVIEGGLTPGELAAVGTGRVAKLFPAHVAGPSYLRSLRAVMPQLELVPTGGIGLDTAAEWLDAGAVAVGIGSKLAEASDLAARVAALRGD